MIERGSARTRLQRAVGDDLAAVLPGPGPDVDDPVRGPDRLLVVLHDEHRVAQVAQPRQRGDQLGVVPLVEADGRLVEDVEDAHQRRPDLGRQPDPLRLAAREADARAVERQVVQAHVHEEPEPGDDLLEHLAGDRPLALRDALSESSAAQSSASVTDSADTSRDAPAVHGHGQDLRPQPAARARGARLLDHELLELGPDVLGLRLLVAALEVRDHALERGDVRVLAALVAVLDDDLLVLGGVRAGTPSPRAAGPRPASSMLQPCEANTASVIFMRHEISVGILFHGDQGARLDALGPVRDHEVRVHHQLRAEAGAGGAGAVRRVERERAGLQLVDGGPVVRAGVALARTIRSSKAGGSPSRGTGAMTTTPSPRRSAVSTESARRDVSGSGIGSAGLRVDRAGRRRRAPSPPGRPRGGR